METKHSTDPAATKISDIELDDFYTDAKRALDELTVDVDDIPDEWFEQAHAIAHDHKRLHRVLQLLILHGHVTRGTVDETIMIADKLV